MRIKQNFTNNFIDALKKLKQLVFNVVVQFCVT